MVSVSGVAYLCPMTSRASDARFETGGLESSKGLFIHICVSSGLLDEDLADVIGQNEHMYPLH